MRILSAVMLAVLALAAHAGPIYKCEDKGAVTFTDQPCASGVAPYRAPGPVLSAPPTASERDLAAQYDARIERDRLGRDRADAKWLKDQRGLKDRAERVRKAIIEHRVIRGMTAAEVKQSLGEPDRVRKSESHGSRKETWTYAANGATRTVNFKNGEVSTASRREKESR